jgi:putative Mn2+ efflux pump MntP
MPRYFSFFLIVIVGIIAIYVQAKADQNLFILIAGIVILMLGVYTISRNIPSKEDQDDEHQNNL